MKIFVNPHAVERFKERVGRDPAELEEIIQKGLATEHLRMKTRDEITRVVNYNLVYVVLVRPRSNNDGGEEYHAVTCTANQPPLSVIMDRKEWLPVKGLPDKVEVLLPGKIKA